MDNPSSKSIYVFLFFFIQRYNKSLHTKIHYYVVYYTYTYTNIKHKYKYRRTLLFQVRTVLLPSDFGSSTRGERHSSYYANHTIWPYYADTQRILWCIRSLSVVIQKNPTTSSTGQIQLSTDSFSKSSNSQDHLFRAWHHSHSSHISCLGVYDDTGDCLILFVRV